MFTKFWTGGVRGGSGLGLYLVNGLTRAHGGSITLDDAEAGGARVVVEWPAAEVHGLRPRQRRRYDARHAGQQAISPPRAGRRLGGARLSSPYRLLPSPDPGSDAASPAPTALDSAGPSPRSEREPCPAPTPTTTPSRSPRSTRSRSTAARDEALAAIEAAADLAALKQVRLDHAGDRSPLALANREIGALPPQARKEAGQRVGQARGAVNQALAARTEVLEAEHEERMLVEETVDVTLPGRPRARAAPGTR